jgi:hypothetical protein
MGLVVKQNGGIKKEGFKLFLYKKIRRSFLVRWEKEGLAIEMEV